MKIRDCKLNSQKKQRGIAIVEFVVAAPVILFITLAVAEFGNALMQYNTLTQSLRDGARQLANTASKGSTGIVAPTDDDIIEAKNLVVYGTKAAGTAPLLPGLATGNVTVNVLATDKLVELRVDYPYRPLLIGGVPKVFTDGAMRNTFTLSAEMVIRPI